MSDKTPCGCCGSTTWHARAFTSCTECGGKLPDPNAPWREVLRYTVCNTYAEHGECLNPYCGCEAVLDRLAPRVRQAVENGIEEAIMGLTPLATYTASTYERLDKIAFDAKTTALRALRGET